MFFKVTECWLSGLGLTAIPPAPSLAAAFSSPAAAVAAGAALAVAADAAAAPPLALACWKFVSTYF